MPGAYNLYYVQCMCIASPSTRLCYYNCYATRKALRVLFLSFADVILSYVFTWYEGVKLYNQEEVIDVYTKPDSLPPQVLLLYIFQVCHTCVSLV